MNLVVINHFLMKELIHFKFRLNNSRYCSKCLLLCYKYVGDVRNGNPNGQGVETSPEGEQYEGEWKDGGFEGQGTVS